MGRSERKGRALTSIVASPKCPNASRHVRESAPAAHAATRNPPQLPPYRPSSPTPLPRGAGRFSRPSLTGRGPGWRWDGPILAPPFIKSAVIDFIDDAYISFRYVWNLSHGNGWPSQAKPSRDTELTSPWGWRVEARAPRTRDPLHRAFLSGRNRSGALRLLRLGAAGPPRRLPLLDRRLGPPTRTARSTVVLLLLAIPHCIGGSA
jgi:hypothetical protein